MSLVIAIKDKGRVVLGSDKQVSTASNKNHKSTKIWGIEKLPDAVMGGVGIARGNQVIQYSDIIDLNDFPVDMDTAYVVRNVAPIILGTLKANGVNCDIPEDGPCAIMPNSYIFAYKDKAWVICNDQSVEEVEDYVAIGSGSDVANGALFATPDRNPFDRIVTAIDAASETTLFVDDGVDIIATAYTSHDKEQLYKALGLENKEKSKTKKATKEKTSKEKAAE